ncbi:anti-sigma factor family protein [Fimbriimonas ginsengisoli]|uniref:Transmembrane anti-sigma factor n=1 Tax=Fimbriimonas ginsengisoli Gsoil 348 TaxID=661478 RepID=A0A068NJ04_FIMGI|nr:hypothetical protein [Fimbriimonas ginsengisoli]AIE83548.1 hypothetical protein OP10G_0180 [Fimbriimonas ginsengisoli Gsoil 348]
MIDPIELHAWADGEIAPERESAIRTALAESPESRAELEAILGVKRLLREKVKPVECHAEWKACASRIKELNRTRKVERFVSGRTAWGLAGGLFGVILLAGMFKHAPEDANIHSADLARLVTNFGPSRGMDPATKKDVDQLLIEAGQSLDPNRLSVLSSARGEVDGRPVTRLALRDAAGDLALVMVPDLLQLDGLGEVRRDHSYRLGHIGQWNCIAWAEGRYTMMLVADRSYEDLVTTASRITLNSPGK